MGTLMHRAIDSQRVARGALACLAGALALTLSACAGLQDSGRLQLGARFARPAAGARQVLVIPDKTAKIIIRVSGDRIPAGSVLAATLTPTQSTTTFEAVPSGPKTINAKCYDADDAVLATGEINVVIIPSKTISAQLRLQPLSDEGGFNLVIQ